MKKDKIHNIRHSLAHLLAMAVKEKDPEVKFAIGPTIDNGFYYDFEFSEGFSLSDKDLKDIQKRMKKLVSKKIDFVEKEITEKEALEIFKDQPYKLELIKEFAQENKKITVYESGSFTDLCEGPHIKNTEEINTDAFKLTRLAGAYWRGDEKNIMLTRIYGIAFETKEELGEYLTRQEEAEKRDHRKLGKELDLFCFSSIVGAGLPLFTPKGTVIKEELQKHIEKVCRNYGFQTVITPHLAKIDLYEISGHAKKFGKELFHVSSEAGHDFVMKPVQCPHQTQIYASRPRSYKDLPIRYMESEKQYRAEKTGEVGGLNRVYAITVEDGHTFCTPDQVKNEIIGLVNIIKDFYTALGLWDNHWVSLSVRDYAHPEKYIGEPEDWDLCEEMLQVVSNELGLNAKRCEGEAALYGPKLDFMFRDAMGKEVQIPTVQVDFATPKKFNLLYTDKNGIEKHPVMVHRAVLGSYERFMALLIEHFAGAFPLWLSPIQVRVLPIADTHKKYAAEVFEKLKNSEIRAEIDDSNETLGKKIRNCKLQKIPYFLVIGDKEIEDKTVTIESRSRGNEGSISVDKLVEKFNKEIKEKK
ncbi:MAG: threonine--tRNA ligase [Candidatus Pacebacteria bacterium]|nr:threonine--tRNA ligase [Candidatus Paceibacterota bacterium]